MTSAHPSTSHLIFDFFGTLVDHSSSQTSQGYAGSHALYASHGGGLDELAFVECWAGAFAELDASNAESHREYSMRDAAASFATLASFRADDGVLDALAALYLLEWNAGVRAIDGVSAMLERLAARFDLSIITNTHDLELVPNHLQAMGVEHLFSRVVTSIGFGLRKPSPAIFEFALGELSAAPGQCIYVGDTFVADYEGPRAVGIRGVLIDPDGARPIDPADRIDSILDLEASLRAQTKV